jgi:quercetin dioxygenase-like cupin family protein
MTAGDPGEPIREVLAEAEGLRVQLVSLAAGQSIPWHTHTFVADMIIAVVGTVEVELEPPAGASRLQPGECWTIPAGTPHIVHGPAGAACRFVNVHTGGSYDFQPYAG